jgi:hypothetical protein
MEKKIRKICKNCKLYNPVEGVCGVTVLHEGEYLELKVKPNDRCWWEKMEHELTMMDGDETEVSIQQIRVQYDLDSSKIKIESPNDSTLNEG